MSNKKSDARLKIRRPAKIFDRATAFRIGAPPKERIFKITTVLERPIKRKLAGFNTERSRRPSARA